ncbi:MAG: transcriptional repressor [Ardenticatenales bacterium]|nr:transcriptional repressor [Ardenticatenales bacterium]
MSDHIHHLQKVLRASGRPITPQRLQIWEALHATRDHPTAAELHTRCPDLPLATVYNALELFTALGLVHPLALAGVVRYDVDTQAHVNVICTSCGKVADVSLALPPAMQEWVRVESGYALSHPRVDWYGECPTCQER